MSSVLEKIMHHLAGITAAIWDLWLDMGIYLVFGFTMAGILSRVLKQSLIIRHLGSNSLGSVTKASLFGLPLPLCSCGVIPVGLSLLKRGASRGAVTSFLISTPQIGADSILVTYGLLGPFFAVVRPITGFLSGFLGGSAVAWMDRNAPEKAAAAPISEAAPATQQTVSRNAALAGPKDERMSLWRHFLEVFRYGFLEFPREIVKWLVIGIVLAGILAHFMPANFVEQYLGGGFRAMLAMAVVGIPLYICSTASVPFVTVLVVHGGLSAGAALVFLITGPATNLAALVLVFRALGRRATVLYLGAILFTSFAGGWLLDTAFAAAGTTLSVQAATHSHHEDSSSWLRVGGAAGLAGIVIVGFAQNWRDRFRKKKELLETAEQEEAALELEVMGMTCENCVRHVSEAIEALPDVAKARVHLKRGTVQVFGDAPDRAAVIRAIESAGYQVR